MNSSVKIEHSRRRVREEAPVQAEVELELLTLRTNEGRRGICVSVHSQFSVPCHLGFAVVEQKVQEMSVAKLGSRIVRMHSFRCSPQVVEMLAHTVK